jgi:phosphate transport system protein
LITLDHQITKRRFAIEMDCLALIVTHQPVDGDLRAVTSILEIITELEHMGRYVTDIAKTQFMVARLSEPLLGSLAHVHEMAKMTQNMLHRGLLAFEQDDLLLAYAVHQDDKALDALYRQICGDAVGLMTGQSRTAIKQTRYLTQIARNLERAADRVTNICEWVAFAITGELNAINREQAGFLQDQLV